MSIIQIHPYLCVDPKKIKTVYLNIDESPQALSFKRYLAIVEMKDKEKHELRFSTEREALLAIESISQEINNFFGRGTSDEDEE